MILHLGVLDFQRDDNISNGDLAEILEDHYGVFSTFAELHGPEIGEDIASALAGQIENMLMGAPVSSDPFAAGTAKIEQRFRHYLDTEEIATVGEKSPRFPIPTQAALDGVNHRLKSGHGARRPSLIDTGVFEASMKAWVEE